MDHKKVKNIIMSMMTSSTIKFWLKEYKTIFDMSKQDIVELINKMYFFDENDANNESWKRDSIILKNAINEYCLTYRCYSLYLKPKGDGKMTKEKIIQAMKKWYMPNYFDLEFFDYTKLSDEEIYGIYLEDLENWGDELTKELEKHC